MIKVGDTLTLSDGRQFIVTAIWGETIHMRPLTYADIAYNSHDVYMRVRDKLSREKGNNNKKRGRHE